MIKSSIKGLIPGLTTLILSFFLIATANADPVKVGFVYIGPVGDPTPGTMITNLRNEPAKYEPIESKEYLMWRLAKSY